MRTNIVSSGLKSRVFLAAVLAVMTLGALAAVAESATELAAQARRYFLGDGVPKDPQQAFSLYRQAAELGNAEGQNGLGACYAAGMGTKQNDREAVRWFSLAAEQGLDKAQLNLAKALWDGAGVKRDRVGALTWAMLATLDGYEPARVAYEKFSAELTAVEVVTARVAAREWLAKSGTPHKQLPRPVMPANNRLLSTGTGFFVSRAGHLLTCAHVVGRSRNVWIHTSDGLQPALVLRLDAELDLALLQVDGGGTPVALGDSATVELGQRVFTVGFPNSDIQGLNPKFTSGDVSALTGPRDASGLFQISVPVQPGNSGGPLADQHGNVIGIVNAKLSAGPLTVRGRPAPENVNYAIQINQAMALLESVPGVGKSGGGRGRGKAAAADSAPARAAIARVEHSVGLVVVFAE
ncbi:MAG: putative serine protease HtrA [Planctomycetes bacterium ADurb.Bin412]|nr:MAG: putative serine protease HtrA [Planctomycetes bacterium ADurb.Bin412]